MFSSITQQQIDLMVHALNTLPPHMLQKLTGLVGGIGPVQSVQVASPGAARTTAGLTMTPVFSIGTRGAMKFGPWGSGLSFGTRRAGISLGGSGAGLSLGGGGVRLLGRKLQQDGCQPFLQVRHYAGFHALVHTWDVTSMHMQL
jgi:hypothetical protein